MKLSNSLNLLHTITNIPIHLYKNDVFSSSFGSYTVPQKLQNIIQSNIENIKEKTTLNTITRINDVSGLSLFGFSFNSYCIVFGPYIDQEIKASTISDLKKRLRFISEDSVMIDNFYETLIILLPNQIEYLYHIVNSTSKKQTIKPSYITIESKKVKLAKEKLIDNLFIELEYVTTNYQIEDSFMQVVKSGDVSKAKTFPSDQIMKQLPKRAQNDSLRNSKTRLTILNTLCNRAAISGGIDVQLGHSISTNYGIQIENMKSIYDSSKLTKEILISYTDAVNNYSLKTYSTLLKSAILAIRRNITERYTIRNLSEELFISKEHLSRVFKKETGYTVSEYIFKSKILEAKRLLNRSSHSILHISEMLGFNNNSHFSTLFKKFEGISPSQYKKGKSTN
jgi:AraC-like DNA-binding protein